MQDAIPLVRQLVRDWAKLRHESSDMEDIDRFSEEHIAPVRERLLEMYHIYVPIPVLEWGPLYMSCGLSWYIAMPGKGTEVNERAYVCLLQVGDIRFSSAETALHLAMALNQGKELLDEQPSQTLYQDEAVEQGR